MTPRGYSAVPEIDARRAWGSGSWEDERVVVEEVGLLAESLLRHEFPASREDLRVITPDGDSMEPLLASGDRILVGMSQRIPVPPGRFGS